MNERGNVAKQKYEPEIKKGEEN